MPTPNSKTSEAASQAQARKVIEKIVVNAGVGRAAQHPTFEEIWLVQIMRDMELLVGQHPQVRRSKRSIAGFKMREGQIVGLRVTLRDRKMAGFWSVWLE